LNLSVDASAFYPSIEPYYGDGDLPFLRVADVYNTIDYDNCTTIPNTLIENHPTLKTANLGDIVLTKGGSIARVGLITKLSAVSRDLIFINSSKLEFKDAIYLYIYFQTQFCNQLLLRSSSQSVQAHLTITLVRELFLLKASDKFKTILLDVILKSSENREESKILYSAAEDLLLSELGLNDWQPTEETVAIKSFSESFLSSGRLDAEHYKPKYDQALVKLRGIKSIKIVELENILLTITNGQTPLHHDLSIGEVKFLTAEHIHDFKINYATNKRVLLHHHQNELARTHLLRGDILLTIKGRVGNAAVVENINELVNINQDVAILRLMPEVNPYYVAGFINSSMGKLLVEKISTGQINPFLGLGNLRKLSIPIFAAQRMDEIGHAIKYKIDDAYKAQRQSQQLLEIAKTGVERAIETDEATATTWMNQQLKALGVDLP